MPQTHALPPLPRFLHGHSALLACLLLAGCLGSKPQQDPYLHLDEQAIFAHAQSAIAEQHPDTALEALEALEAAYPFGTYATQAQRAAIYLQWQQGKPDLAVAAADRFIRLHPSHPHVDYAYFMKGVIPYLDTGPKFLENWFKVEQVERHAAGFLQAREAFATLIQRCPNSRYVAAAQQLIDFLDQKLAYQELSVAEYYWARKAPVATINRITALLEKYPDTPSARKALPLLARAYRMLEMPEAASKVEALERHQPHAH